MRVESVNIGDVADQDAVSLTTLPTSTCGPSPEQPSAVAQSEHTTKRKPKPSKPKPKSSSEPKLDTPSHRAGPPKALTRFGAFKMLVLACVFAVRSPNTVVPSLLCLTLSLSRACGTGATYARAEIDRKIEKRAA